MLKGERCNSPKCAMSKRPFAPGFHGPKARPNAKKSDYALQLNEKQKARKQYLLSEHQFRIIFDKAAKKVGNTEKLLIQYLEMRFDNVIYRLGFAQSRPEARQLVGHGHFTVNGKKVNIPSYQVKTGDVIKIKESSKRSKRLAAISSRVKSSEVPGWLNLNMEDLSAKVLHEPAAKDLKSSINPHVIVEFYSR